MYLKWSSVYGQNVSKKEECHFPTKEVRFQFVADPRFSNKWGGGSLARIKKRNKLRFYNACDGFVKGFPFFCHNLIRPLITQKEKNAFNMNIEVYLGHHKNFKVVNKLKLIAKVFTFVTIVCFSNVFVSIR